VQASTWFTFPQREGYGILYANVKPKELLVCGTVAGPLFTVVWIVAGATRANYDLLQHPISSLSIGAFGSSAIRNANNRKTIA
jgi:hypothetical protein